MSEEVFIETNVDQLDDIKILSLKQITTRHYFDIGNGIIKMNTFYIFYIYHVVSYKMH